MVTPMPAEGGPFTALQPAQINVALGQELAILGSEIGAHGGHNADRRENLAASEKYDADPPKASATLPFCVSMVS